MDWNHLTPEEIDFELLLRNTTGIRGKDLVWKIARLQQLIEREINGTPAPMYSTHVVSDMDSIYYCQTTLSPIFLALNVAFKQGNITQVTSLRSRLLHYKFRLSLIADSMIVDNAKKTSTKIDYALQQIEDFLQENAIGGQEDKKGTEDLPSDPETLKRLKIAQLQSSIDEAGKQQKVLEQELQHELQTEMIPGQSSSSGSAVPDKVIPESQQRQQIYEQKSHQNQLNLQPQQFMPQQHSQPRPEQRHHPTYQLQRPQQEEQQGFQQEQSLHILLNQMQLQLSIGSLQ